MGNTNDIKIYKVSELNRLSKSLIESELGTIWVEGEVSGLSKAQSGHIYFTLKDSFAEIDCALFRQKGVGKQHLIENGLVVQLFGRATIYESKGRYQFVVWDLKLGGEGALLRAFESLKKKLKDEGLFEAEHKKTLPYLPRKLGVVTSPSGSAVHDIIRVFARRSPATEILIYPASVQGNTAPKELVNAIQLANTRNEVDVLIVGRGGGSIEDLWAFNEEIVARAIYESRIPIVSGVGHQTDSVISDFVADKFAATPTAAAEIVSTPSEREVLGALASQQADLETACFSLLNNWAQRVDLLQKALVHPRQQIERLKERFEKFNERIASLSNRFLYRSSTRVNAAYQKLMRISPATGIQLKREKIENFQKLINLHVADRIKNNAKSIEVLRTQLEGVNPTATLSRGYAIVRRVDDGAILRSSSGVAAGEKVTAQLSKGKLVCDVEAVEGD